tara:strand:+ start:225 stop:689 length:465 start_codon:yes stop_codon:yes gene_type:complete
MKLTRSQLNQLLVEVISADKKTEIYNKCLSSKGLDPSRVLPDDEVAFECISEFEKADDAILEELLKYYAYANSLSSRDPLHKHLPLIKQKVLGFLPLTSAIASAKYEEERMQYILKNKSKYRQEAERLKSSGYSDIQIHHAINDMFGFGRRKYG